MDDEPGEHQRLLKLPVWALVLMGISMLMGGLVGAAYLLARVQHTATNGAVLSLPGTTLTTDRPDGWSVRDLDTAPEVVDEFLLSEPDQRPQGVVLTDPHGAVLFVLHVPNPSALQSVPPFPQTMGPVRVLHQEARDHPVGPARELTAEAESGDSEFAVLSTFILTEDRIVVLGAISKDGIGADQRAAYDMLLTSLKRGAKTGT